MDKFGYYFAGGVKTYSKIEARQLGRTTWHFNDEVFSSIDTTKEPTPLLWELYEKRAQQIRDKYDYVVLMYSGGSDSHTVLDAFLAADCKIDEICSTWDYPTTGLAESYHNAEFTHVIQPRIAALQKEGVEFRFRTIDITSYGYRAISELGTDFEYYTNHHMSPNNIGKHFLRDGVKEWRDMIASGKKLVLVWGLDKPVISYDSGKFYMAFRDMIDNCVGPYCNKPGWYDELFFWTPDMPMLPIKQAHLVKSFCQLVHDPVYYQDEVNNCGYNPTLGKYLRYDALKTIIYPTWSNDTFCNGKSTTMIYSLRDAYFFNGNVLVRRYKEIVDSAFVKMHDTTPEKDRFAVIPMLSRLYEL